MKTIKVNTKKSYDIYLGEGLLPNLHLLVKNIIKNGKVGIITDHIVETLYGQSLTNALSLGNNQIFMYSFKAGENSKTPETYFDLICKLKADGFGKGDSLIALGGGVCGDIAGFVASTYMRGIKLIVIPTTLLACVDSAIGGKNALNIEQVKNLVGTVYQPDLVIIDTSFLKSLDENNRKNGLGEIIKYAFIGPEVYEDLVNQKSLYLLIEHCLNIKKSIVEKDENDTGIRHLLNLGHTAGHGIEAASQYEIPHGIAVAMGLYIAAGISNKLGLCPPSLPDQIKELIISHGISLKPSLDLDAVIQAIKMDKKGMSHGINLVLPVDIGKSQILYKSHEELENLIREVW